MTGRMTGYLISKIHDIDHDLRAREPMPWLDFVGTYTYPGIKIDNGAGLPDKSMLGCFLEGEGYGDFFDCILDQIISLPDVIAYKFQEFGCELIAKNQKVAVEAAEEMYEKKKQAKAKNKKLNDALAAAEEDAGAASDRAEELNRQSDFAAEAASSAGDRMDQYYDSDGNFSDARANEAAMAAAREAEAADEGLSNEQLARKYNITNYSQNSDGTASDAEFNLQRQILAKQTAAYEAAYAAAGQEYMAAADAAEDFAYDQAADASVAASRAEEGSAIAADAATDAASARRARDEALAEFKAAKSKIADAAQETMLRNAQDALKAAGVATGVDGDDKFWGDIAEDSKQQYEGFKSFLKSEDLAKEAESIKDWKKTSCGVFPRDGDLMDQALPGWLQNVITGRGSGLTMYAKLYRNVFSRLTFCGLLGLMQAGLECIFAGISFADAMMVLIKAAFKDMPPYSLGKLFIGLPVDKQLAIEEKVKKQLKELNMSSFVDMKAVMSASDEMMQGAAEDLADEMSADYLNEAENLDKQFAAGTISQ